MLLLQRRRIRNNIGVNSGVYAGIQGNISMRLNEYGQYEYVGLKQRYRRKTDKVNLMSRLSANEDIVSEDIFSGLRGIKHDKYLGYYLSLYTGHVVESNYRAEGSSGGFGTWVLVELLKNKEIDGVVHVVESKTEGKLFEYSISRTINEIKAGAKSRYYPVEMSEVLKVIARSPGKYAIVGIPEFITEIRLLSRESDIFRERIKYTIGLVCGHQKSTKYTDALAWQHGISPGFLKKIDYRKKQEGINAYDYLTHMEGDVNGVMVEINKKQDDNFVGNWGNGFFKARFSDLTDNAFNENADITLGDAWLEEYLDDTKGSNIIIVRNPVIDKIIRKAIREKRVDLRVSDSETIIRSQQGLVHHVRDELPYRLHRQKIRALKTPVKRLLSSAKLNPTRKKIQRLREKIAVDSHIYYRRAERLGDFNYFMKKMKPYTIKYDRLYDDLRVGRQGGATSFIASIKPRTRLKRLRSKLRLRTRLKSLKQRLRPRTRLRAARERIMTGLAVRANGKKDGLIVTMASNFNYGNIIQRYALKTYLKKHGFDFDNLSIRDWSDEINQAPFAETKRFVAQYIGGEEFSSERHQGYRNYIVGSDQVWRNWWGGWEEFSLYFLEFLGDAEVNRIAYAASFGVDSLGQAKIDSEQVKLIRPLIRKFNAISVREKSGVKLVKKLVKSQTIKPVVVLDPVFMLSADDYSDLIDKSSSRQSDIPSVFCYILDDSKGKTSVIEKIAKTKNSDFMIINPQNDKKYEPVELWLKGFRDSDIVVTDSFHGVVLSVVNNRDFVVIGNEERGMARFISVLEVLGVSNDRLVLDLRAFDYDKIEAIDWPSVNKRLDKLRKESGDWLLSYLEN